LDGVRPVARPIERQKILKKGNTMKITRLSSLMAWMLAGILIQASLMAESGSKREKNELYFERFVKPWVLDSTYLNVNGEATIDVAMLFDDTGRVDDWLPIRTNDMKLVQSIQNVVGEWRIRPPHSDGVPVWSYYEFEVRFLSDGAVVSLSMMEAVMSFTKTMRDNLQLVVPFSELDGIPRPLHMEPPRMDPKLLASSSGESVIFEFFIDSGGKVRMPLVKNQHGVEEVAAAIMLDSLLKWEFEPPRRHGRAVSTRAKIPFRIP
jgi:hypothetical protein